MNKLIKSLTPPLLLDKAVVLRNYKHFVKYKELVAKNIELKNIHKGKRCFILGSGSSIKKENLKLLKSEIVFALNNFYVHENFPEIMSWDCPKYYMTAPIHPPQTEGEWKAWFKDMEGHVPQNTRMLFGLNCYEGNIKYIFDKYNLFEEHNTNWYYAGVKVGEYYKFKEKDIDITNMVWSANTVSIYALIFAIYMGFEEIYLLGMDHDYMCKPKDNWRFYKDAVHQKDETKRLLKNKSYNQHSFNATSQIFRQYQILKDNNSNKIFNCSNISLLDIFEYKNFGDIIK